MILLPRLDKGEVDLVCAMLNRSNSDPQEAIPIVEDLDLRPHWNLSGGMEVSKNQILELVKELEQRACDNGYPDYPSVSQQQNFDRHACRLLKHADFLQMSGGETKRSETWAGMVCLYFLHLAIWRHSAPGKGINQDRLRGGPRNFLRRLWLRNEALMIEGLGGEGAWKLIDELSEDAFVQIIERPSLASDNRLSCFMGLEWTRHNAQIGKIEDVMRVATKRVRATGQTRLLMALDDESLEKIVAQAFDYAINQFQ